MYLKDLREKLINEINASQLDIDMVYFVVKDIFAELSSVYNQEIAKEKLQKSNKEAEKIEKEEK